MSVQKIIGLLILAYGAAFGAYLVLRAFKNKDKMKAEHGSPLAQAIAEAAVYFLSTMGFPDFVMNTLAFKRFGWTEDGQIPPTLVAAAVTPGTIIAYSYLRNSFAIDLKLLLLCIAAAAAGSFVGANVVTGLDGQLIRKIMAVAMAFSIVALIVKLMLSSAASDGGEVTLVKLIIAVPVIFALAFLNMFGVPMKAPLTALFLLLGFTPIITLTLVLTLGVISPIFGGISVLKNDKYVKKVAVNGVVFGSVGAVLGTMFTVTLDATLLNIILIAIMAFTVYTLGKPKKQ